MLRSGGAEGPTLSTQTLGGVKMSDLLSERKRMILSEIINDFVSCGDPVGSARIAGRPGIGLSAASIRNTMSDLEAMGYLTHPHTSAGRVPTEKAYRYYIDSLQKYRSLSSDDRSLIERRVSGGLSLPDALQEGARILSSLCRQISIVMKPSFSNIIFKHIEFISLGKGRLLAILVSRTGLVVNKVFEVEETIGGGDLEKINNYLNAILEGLSIREVKVRIVEEMRAEKALYDTLLAKALRLGADFMSGQREGDISVEGAANLFDQLEFIDTERMKRIFKTFEEKSLLVDLLDRAIRSKDLNVWIGSETGMDEMKDLSLITSPYGTGERVLGCIGILGPTRMDYSRVIPIVSYTADKISEIIRED